MFALVIQHARALFTGPTALLASDFLGLLPARGSNIGSFLKNAFGKFLARQPTVGFARARSLTLHDFLAECMA